ncbi:hypothetical protein LTR99_004351 [Exophiala xenobiotica]|uniref:Uncharacterized protein n=1 Tax=Vermiconidia calcicola TaxID=1690605 RepID=A0AAV9QDM1_9PEZI|nr:hypothetical protein LTR96_001541 [Exophiala xenobiotica]KAK5537914.1 hypothetical protein LTR23_007374 [Chaetothyriales sp. CCFEE 6169]KAK5539632.1 hypothetical protein LTR25_003336 [Vermiconidia calcicola]KAK5303896.1 hypothetical protein LTR99_004351 [Exophiala xenobiotica]KAK5338507.1 hypothetical protein LTR98_004906 [Exophiala xenobiotica]
MWFQSLLLLTSAGAALALRPSNISICDYYAPLVTGKNNSAESQYELMLKVTHTFILGNYTTPNVGVAVQGIAGVFPYMGHDVNLLPYFVGGYASTNTGGSDGKAVNFLDDGGASALLANMPSNGTNSNQYKLLTHVYQYFGEFFGCSQQGADAFPKYQGEASLYEVHKFMDLDIFETGWFNAQIVLAVQSFGFEDPDVTFTREGLNKTFTARCIPPAAVIPASAGPQLQSICIAPDCPLDPQANCSAYPNNGIGAQPAVANATIVGPAGKDNGTAAPAPSSGSSSSMSSSSTATGSAAISSHTGGAVHTYMGWTTLKTVGVASLIGAGVSAFAF